MNILFITLIDVNNIDERGIYTDLLREFIKNGHSVFVVSPTERRSKKKTQVIDDGEKCKILKVKTGNIQKTNIIEKGITTLLIEPLLKIAIKQYLINVSYDMVLYSTPPVTFANIVQYIKKRDNATSYLLLKDIFPQNAVDLNLISKTGFKGLIYKYFRKKEKKLYSISDYIGCMSPANVAFLLKQNNELKNKPVEICPNSITPNKIFKLNKYDLKKKFDISPDCVSYIYGGNLGKPQNIDFVVRCLLKNININDRYFIICGNGTEFYKLDKFFNEFKPQNMRLVNWLLKPDYNQLLLACDVGLIFLDHRFTIPNYPSRILSYMENVMPVLACTNKDTDIREAIEIGKFGWWCESNDEKRFTDLVDNICNNRNLIKKLGMNARLYLEDNFTVQKSYQIIMKHFSTEKAIDNYNEKFIEKTEELINV